jgi:hypothetical protein
VIAVIYSVPERAEHVRKLVDLLTPDVRLVVNYSDDEHRGQRWNYTRALREGTALANPDEPVLITTDDVLPVRHWRARFDALHEQARAERYCLFTRCRHVITPATRAVGFHRGIPARGFYDQAAVFVNQSNLAERVEDWFSVAWYAREDLRKRQAHRFWDIAVQEYLRAHSLEWVTAVPSLFDHLPFKSTMGAYKIGGATLLASDEAP